MRRFTLIIGSMDDFEDADALLAAYREHGDNFCDYSATRVLAAAYSVELPEIANIGTNMSVERIAEFYLFGKAFTEDWCAEGTFSILLNE